MNIFVHELRSMRKSTVIWAASLIALSAIFLCVYPNMAKGCRGVLKRCSADIPRRCVRCLASTSSTSHRFLGFYSMIFSFIVLIGASQAMIVGSSVLSRESRERTADFLLTKPVSRTTIVTSKLCAAVTMILATDIVFYVASVLIAAAAGATGYSAKLFLMINLMLPFVQLIFLSIGICVSVFFGKLKSVLPLSLGTVFGFYFIGAIIATGKDIALERFVSPFKYFDIFYIIEHASYEAQYLIAGLAIVLIAVILSYVVYNSKDIHAVS